MRWGGEDQDSVTWKLSVERTELTMAPCWLGTSLLQVVVREYTVPFSETTTIGTSWLRVVST